MERAPHTSVITAFATISKFSEQIAKLHVDFKRAMIWAQQVPSTTQAPSTKVPIGTRDTSGTMDTN